MNKYHCPCVLAAITEARKRFTNSQVEANTPLYYFSFPEHIDEGGYRVCPKGGNRVSLDEVPFKEDDE